MRKVELGHTGEKVSTFCLGAMYFGTRQNKKETYALLDQYVGAGGDFIDTANIYAWWIVGFRGGESETMLGAWLKERQNREKIFLATKVGFGYQDVPISLRADIIEQECNKSLKRLGVEAIDLYYAHTDDRSTPLDETIEAFNRLVKAGKVRYIGASNYTAWRLEEARWLSHQHDWPTYCCVQQRHSYIRRKHGTTFSPQLAANYDLLDFCRNRKVSLLAYSPLLSRGYTHPERPFGEQYLGPDTENRITALHMVAQELGATPNQVVLAWMLHSDPHMLPLVAASTSEQMGENLDALDITLTADQMERLDSAGP